MKNILITICGRAGSKGVKSKNFRPFLGKPLIFYTLKSAILFREKYRDLYNVDIVVSTDSIDILDYVKEFPAVLSLERPAHLAQDDTPKVPVIQQATLYAEQKYQRIHDYVVDLDITSPLRKSEDIEHALQMCQQEEKQYDLIFTAAESRRNPYFNMVEVKDGFAYKIKESDYVCRQQAPKTYDMNPSIYCYNRNSLINKLKRITFEGKSGVLELEDTYVIDIDRGKDFEILELLVKEYFIDQYPELFS